MGGKGSGRLTAKQKLQREGGSAMQKLERSAPEAAQYLIDVANGNIPAQKVSWPRINVSTYILNQVIGMPKSRVTVSDPNGKAIKSYTEIILLAERAAKEQPSSQIITVEPRQLSPASHPASQQQPDYDMNNGSQYPDVTEQEPNAHPERTE